MKGWVFCWSYVGRCWSCIRHRPPTRKAACPSCTWRLTDTSHPRKVDEHSGVKKCASAVGLGGRHGATPEQPERHRGETNILFSPLYPPLLHFSYSHYLFFFAVYFVLRFATVKCAVVAKKWSTIQESPYLCIHHLLHDAITKTTIDAPSVRTGCINEWSLRSTFNMAIALYL